MIFVIKINGHSREGGNLMKKFAVVLMVIGLAAFLMSTVAMAQEKAAPAAAAHKYIGAGKCKMCHNSPAKGEQFKKWSESSHAKAFATLATPEALEIGKKLGVEKPQESEKCLVCHVTAYSAPAASKEATLTNADGVGCESCHGAGSDYKDMKVMKDHAAAVAAGLKVPDEKLCVTCHNEKSPTYKKFVFAEFAKQIAHPNPAKAAK
jgi:hypothetical protein